MELGASTLDNAGIRDRIRTREIIGLGITDGISGSAENTGQY